MPSAVKTAGESDQGKTGAEGSLGRLPDHPGEDAYTHEGTLWIEQAERVLASKQLLGVANGDEPDDCRSIKTFPYPQTSV